MDGLPAATLPQAGANQPELTGYHVKRDEFEPEFDVDAEHLVAELEFVPGEPQVRCMPVSSLQPCSPLATLTTCVLARSHVLLSSDRHPLSATPCNPPNAYPRFSSWLVHLGFTSLNSVIMVQQLRAAKLTVTCLALNPRP